MNFRIAALLFLLAPLAAAAGPISIGGTQVEVPAPAGYAALTPQMAPVYEMQRQFVAPSNEQFAAYVPESEIPKALKGEVPNLERTFALQTAKQLVNQPVSTADFAEIKNMIVTQNAEVMKKVEEAVPEMMGKVNSDITKKYDVDLALSVSQMMPMPPHYQNERALSYSSYVKYAMKDENGQPADFVVAATTTFMHVKGKVLFLYAYGEEGDLQWSRDASRQWVEAIIAANPPTAADRVVEATPSSVSGINWGEVGEKAVIGAIIGGLIGLFSWFAARRKAK